VSRVGRNPIAIPKGVNIELNDKFVSVKGKLGNLSHTIPENINVRLDNSEILVERENETREVKALHGLTRALIQNMVTGVTDGYVKELHLIGLGYNVEVVGPWIKCALGYSHEILAEIPKGITASVELLAKAKGSRTAVQLKLFIKGISKEDVGKFAAEIRSIRPPENYKGKGLRYSDEFVKIKAGKAGAKK